MSFGMIPLSPDDKPDGFVLLSMYEKLESENAKLREQIHWLKQGDILHVLTDQEYIDQCERERLMQVSIDALDNENAKLREIAGNMYYDLTHMKSRPDWPPDYAADYAADLRELGVEV